MKRLRLGLGVGLAVLVAYLLLTGRHLPTREELAEWLLPLGWMAYPAFALLYGMTSVVGVPATVLMAAGVWLFGLWPGYATNLVGAFLGACGGYAMARFLGRRWVTSKVSGKRRWGRLDEQVKRFGGAIVFLFRVLPSPFPFAMINFMLGVTRIRFAVYVVATAVGLVPNVLFYSWAAHELISPMASGEPPWRSFGFWAAVVALLVVMVGLPILVARADAGKRGRFLETLAGRLTRLMD